MILRFVYMLTVLITVTGVHCNFLADMVPHLLEIIVTGALRSKNAYIKCIFLDSLKKQHSIDWLLPSEHAEHLAMLTKKKSNRESNGGRSHFYIINMLRQDYQDLLKVDYRDLIKMYLKRNVTMDPNTLVTCNLTMANGQKHEIELVFKVFAQLYVAQLSKPVVQMLKDVWDDIFNAYEYFESGRKNWDGARERDITLEDKESEEHRTLDKFDTEDMVTRTAINRQENRVEMLEAPVREFIRSADTLAALRRKLMQRSRGNTY